MTTANKSPSGTIASGSKAAPQAELIRQQINRILNSPEFTATDIQKSFLTFVVETTLAGQSNQIKGYTVATRVFGRGEDFNQATDPIVSIQANKLRRALERYYLVAGQNDAMRIEIPKGTYVPLFRDTRRPKEAPPFQERRKTDQARAHAWPTIVVQPFENLTGNRDLAYMGIGIATEIALEITRYQEIRVLRQIPGGRQRRAENAGARFVLNGSLQRGVSGLKVNVNLVDLSTGIQIWGDSYKTDGNPSELIGFQEEVANTIAGKISCEYGIIANAVSQESRQHPPSTLKTYEAMLRYYKFNAHFSAETFFDAFEALLHASRKEPECGLVWSMLARLYAVNYSLEMFDLETPLEKAVLFAERGVKLEPANQRARMILAFVRLFENEISAGLVETERAMALNPNSMIFLENIGYLLTLFGDWQQGPSLIRKAIEANPYYSNNVHHTLWVDCIRQKDYQQAHNETLNFKMPLLFWEPLMKASTLGLLGRTEEGVQAGKELLHCKPDFSARGRVLIEYYIKFDDIVDEVIQGLKEAGIEVA